MVPVPACPQLLLLTSTILPGSPPYFFRPMLLTSWPLSEQGQPSPPSNTSSTELFPDSAGSPNSTYLSPPGSSLTSSRSYPPPPPTPYLGSFQRRLRKKRSFGLNRLRRKRITLTAGDSKRKKTPLWRRRLVIYPIVSLVPCSNSHLWILWYKTGYLRDYLD